MPISAVDAISLAFEHTKQQLFQPFRFGQWTRLALVGLLAGELSSGGFHGPIFQLQYSPASRARHFLAPGLAGLDLMAVRRLDRSAGSNRIRVRYFLMYISSVMRFILFDSVMAKECRIREGWSRRQGPGWRYFLWKLLYALVMIGVLIVLVGIPLGFAFAWDG